MALSLTAPGVLVGSFSRHFQQYKAPSVLVGASHRLHLRLIVFTSRSDGVLIGYGLSVGIGREGDLRRGRATQLRRPPSEYGGTWSSVRGRAWLQIGSMSWPWRSVCKIRTVSPAAKLAQTCATASRPPSSLVKKIETRD